MNAPFRRGACPGLSAPMSTGDGLLVRLLPIGTMPLDAFAQLCAAARTYGNGIIEVTARGSIQIRGLNAASAPRFAEAVAALGIAAVDGVPVLTNALAGLETNGILDASALAVDLRRAVAHAALTASLAPKVSVVIDGGGALHLDELSADVRLRAEQINGQIALRVGIGGDGANSVQLAVVALADGVEAATRMLNVISQHGRNARARDILAAEGPEMFRAALADLLMSDVPQRIVRGSCDAVGTHRLGDGSLACGVGLAFGHADAPALGNLADAAKSAGAGGMRAAPGRALLIIGLRQEAASSFAAAVERLGFIVRAGDRRRRVIACAGAPICASAHIAARAMAPDIAATAAPFLDGAFTIHLSGCAKGCAHPAPASLTIVGTADGCALVANGSSRGVPLKIAATDELAAAVTRYAREVSRKDGHV